MFSISSRTVAIIGASYGGARVAHLLAQALPEQWRVVLIDRNSHMNHLYVLPRYSVLPGHEHKAFIPYKNVFHPPPLFDTPSPLTPPSPIDDSPHVFLHASVTSLAEHSLVLDKAFPEHGVAEADKTLHFDFLVYALGSHLPAPINLWGPVADEDVDNADVLDVSRGTKEGGVAWMKKFQKRVDQASSVLVVGGGALGIQFASDIAELYPATRVTLLHSRTRLLPRFDEGMHTEILSTLSTLNVCTILGDRLDLASLHEKNTHLRERVVRTQSGREIRANLVLLCTGQIPNTALLRAAFPDSLVPDGPDRGMARVRRTLQLARPAPPPVLPLAENYHDALPFMWFDPACDDEAPTKPSTEAHLESESEPQSESESQSENGSEAEVEPEEDPCTEVAAEHIFAIGDAADAFGAVNAGHNAFFQGEVAARNILRLVKRMEGAAPTDDVYQPLEKYTPGAPAIKVSLGLTKCVYQFQGIVGTKEHEPADLDVHLIWRYFGYYVSREDIESDFEAPPASTVDSAAITQVETHA